MFTTQAANEKRRPLPPLIVLLSLYACVAAAQTRPPPPAAPCAADSLQAVQIESVDIHLDLRLPDGRKLRLLGLEPPRGTPGNPQLAEQARDFLATRLAGRTIAIGLSPDRDRWGRHEALLPPAEAGPGGRTAVGEILTQGLARVDPFGLQPACAAAFLALESSARLSRRGLWADPAYAVINASDTDGYAGQGGRIVIAEGLVVSTGQWRNLTFLNFGRGRGQPSGVLSAPLRRQIEAQGLKPGEFAGRRLRIRGLLQLRPAPRIEIFSAAALEFLPALQSR